MNTPRQQAPTLPRDVRARLGQQLRAHFDYVVLAPIPAELLAKLDMLQKAERARG